MVMVTSHPRTVTSCSCGCSLFAKRCPTPHSWLHFVAGVAYVAHRPSSCMIFAPSPIRQWRFLPQKRCCKPIPKFTDCVARITVEAVRRDDGTWVYRTRNEVIRHNHKCSALIHESYNTNEPITDRDLFVIRTLILAKAPTKNACDVISMLTGRAFTAQQLANFKRDHLGGNTAFQNLRLLISRLAALPGSNTLVIEDENGKVIGIVMQTAAQRAILRRWGENILMDFTHSTNNLGYYLGSLMVTTATGKGVSVMDFLCMSQSKKVMHAVLSHFVATNPHVAHTVQSVVIDKDYTEWVVLREVLPNARVLLCQFHVLKWFVHVVTKKEYQLSMPTREEVLRILRAMVYASTVEEFSIQQRLLYELLCEVSPAFLAYMSKCWYGCRDMWSECERSSVFTAFNTTTNRLESCWNQLKKMLGRKLRIDLCVEVIFAYQTAVLRRELKILSRGLSSVMLRVRADPYIRSACRDVSDYCCDEMLSQWEAYVMNATKYVCTQDDPVGKPTHVTVETLTAGSNRHVVDCERWCCTCSFSVTGGLPCRHIMFVTRDILRWAALPVALIKPRWLFSEAAALLSTLRGGIAQAQTLRTTLLIPDSIADAHVEDEEVDRSVFSSRVPAVAHVQLRLGEVCRDTIIGELQKRNAVVAAFAPLQKLLEKSSTPLFKARIARVRQLVASLVDEFAGVDGGALEDRDTVSTCGLDASSGLDASNGLDAFNELDASSDDGDMSLSDDDDYESRTVLRVEYDAVLEWVDSVFCGGSDGDSIELDLALSAATEEATRGPEADEDGGRVGSSLAVVHIGTSVVVPMSQDQLANLDLRVRPQSGAPRADRASVVHGKRLAHVDQGGGCPIVLSEFVEALMNTPYVASILPLWSEYPRVLTENCIQRRTCTAEIARVLPSSEAINCVVPFDLFASLGAAVRAAQISSVEDTPPVGHEYVATVLSNVRRFSQSCLVSIGGFYGVKKLYDDLVSDMAWVTDMASRFDELRGACASVKMATSALPLRAYLLVRPSNTALQASLQWADVIGYLARRARLSPAVMFFSLCQLASDYMGVHVVHPTACEVDVRPASPCHLLVLPAHFDNLHWCVALACVRPRDATVYLYDPLLQPLYLEKLRSHVMERYTPLLLRLTGGGPLTIEVVRNPHQTDVESTGIYCIMQASDFMSGRHEYRSSGTVPPHVTDVVRLQTLRRLVCDSRRLPREATETEAERVLDKFRVFRAKT